MKRPRVAILAEKYGGIGGGERFVREVTERLAATGRYEFHVFAHRWESGAAEVTFHHVPRIKFPRFLRPWSFTWMAQRAIAAGGFDLVHAHWPTFRADVFSTHGAPHRHWVSQVLGRSPNLFDRVMMMIDRRMVSGGAGSVFMPVSAFLRERFEESFGRLPGRWEVVHPGVDGERFRHDPVARAEERARMGVSPDEQVLLFVGMNFGPKGLGPLLEGFARFRRRWPERRTRLVVVGRGPLAAFERLAGELGVAGDVRFEPPRERGVERLYSAADAFTLLSTFETFGMVVLEAMAAGLPVLVNDRMGVRDIVDASRGIVIGHAASPDEVSDAIASLRVPADRRPTVERPWSTVAERVDAVYRIRLGSRVG